MCSAIVFDMLILSGCGHPDKSRIERASKLLDLIMHNNALHAKCMNELLNVLKECNKNYKARGGCRVYVSKEAFENVVRKMLSQLKDSEHRCKYLENLNRLLTNMQVATRNNCIVKYKRKNECDKFGGYHKIEYCELVEALTKTIKDSEFLCGIFCVNKTFSHEDLIKVIKETTRDAKKMLNITLHMCTHDTHKVVAIFRQENV